MWISRPVGAEAGSKGSTIVPRLPLVVVFLLLATVSSAPLHAQSYIFGRSDIAVGSTPLGIAAGDLNGDGLIDLVVPNSSSNTISVLLGKRDGTFNSQVTYATGETPLSVAVGDFNGDGNLDIAVVNGNCFQDQGGDVDCQYGSVSVFLGQGDGTFLPAVNYAVGSAGSDLENPLPGSIVVADFNGDGKLDLAITNGGSGTISLLLGNGDGTFQGQVVYAIGATPESMVAGDFNGDGKLDLAVACYSAISVLLGNGNGTFQTHLDSGAGGSSLTMADLNHDGKPDLVVTGEFLPLSVLLSNGDGTFITYATYPGGFAVLASDLNSDGNADLLVLDAGSSMASPYSVTVQLGNGDGTFRAGVSYGTGQGPIAVVADDFNGDGRLDIAVANSVDNSISVLLGFGDGTFVAIQDYLSGSASLISTDFNGDGKPDLAATAGGLIEVLPGNGDGTFQGPISTSPGQAPGQIIAGDFNGDRLQDIATVFSNCSNGCLPGNAVLFLGKGDGTFQSPTEYAVGLQPEFLVSGDFNGDGKLDLAVVNFVSASVSVLLGNGDGSFQTHADYLTAQNPRGIAVADLRNDGRVDLVVVADITTSVLLGNGDGTFARHVDYPVSGDSAVLGDFNGDGIPDLVVGDFFNYSVLLGNGDGTFQSPATYPNGGYGATLAAADFNEDHKLDVVIGHIYSVTTSIVLGNGDGTFQAPMTYLNADSSLSSVIAPDLNADGAPDLASTDSSDAMIGVMLSLPFKAVAPSSLNFGSQGVGTSSAPRTITISNPSNVKFNVVAIASSGNFSQTNDCSGDLAPGADCTVSVVFSPMGTGLESGAIMLTDSTRNSPQSISLSGTGVNGPFLSSDPGHVSFLPLTVGMMSSPAAILLRNTGNATLNIVSIAIAGSNNSDFSQTNDCGSSLPPGGTCTVNVVFAPTAGGVRTASVSVTDNASGSPQTISLTGTGLALNNTLTVSINGVGTVTSTDGFIQCPGTCSHAYPSGTQVTLNYSPARDWIFSDWSGNCNGDGNCVVDMTQDMSVGATFTYQASLLQFVPVTPCRVADTRLPNGQFGGPPLQGGMVRTFDVSRSNCQIPTEADAYSLNVTVVPFGRLGYLTIWPTEEYRPTISTMNSLDGRTKANAVIVSRDYGETISVYVTDTTNLVLDINGYFAPVSSSTLAFYPLTPCRVVDTRNTNGDLGGPYLQGNAERDFPVLESSCIPSGVNPQAYSLNITAVPHPSGQRLGYLTVWPEGQSQPLVSTLNNPTGTIVANAAIVPAGTGGGIAVYPNNNTDLLIDVNGYFAPQGAPPNGLSLYLMAPCRVLDTREGSGAFSGELSPPLDVADSPCAVSQTAQAYVFNATVVPVGHLGYLTLWPDGEGQPVVSTLNATDGAITSNMAIVPTNNGSIDAYASALTQLIVDISSYFAP